MIKSVSIQIERGLAMNWVLNIDVVETGFDNLSYDIEISEQTQSGTFKGPLASIVRMLPEALKAMGIAEAGSEPAHPTQNLTRATSDMIKAALEEMPLEDYLKVKQFLENKDLKAAPEAKADAVDEQYYRDDPYYKNSEASVEAIKRAIVHGPPDQTTK